MESTGASEEDARRVVLEFYRAKAQSVQATLEDDEVQFIGKFIDIPLKK